MQTDGNLVERSPSGRAMWTSKTPNNPGAKLVMRVEGVLAIVSTTGKTLWYTPTYGARGARLEIADDANVVVRGTAGQPWWANGASGADGTRLPVSQRHTSSHQVTLTKIYEGLVGTTPYHNANGNCTVGYGHLIRLGACTSNDLAKTWDVDALFADDVADHEHRLASSLGSLMVTQREYDTLWDYVFGRGSLTATTSPKMYAALTASPVKYADVPVILRENGDIQSLTGLCDRRYDEADVFAGGMYDRSYSC
jgi:GH24 family phage-related lysozyme (muramidase)